jgi:predicted  nucleic acid-binding Zn-ribbon protein
MTVSKERWFTLSLADQLGHIGSEVGRARTWQSKDEESFWGAIRRALELFDLTQEDQRWKKRRKELDRARESFADAVLGGKEYGSSLPDLEKYFMQFALLARKSS